MGQVEKGDYTVSVVSEERSRTDVRLSTIVLFTLKFTPPNSFRVKNYLGLKYLPRIVYVPFELQSVINVSFYGSEKTCLQLFLQVKNIFLEHNNKRGKIVEYKSVFQIKVVHKIPLHSFDSSRFHKYHTVYTAKKRKQFFDVSI